MFPPCSCVSSFASELKTRDPRRETRNAPLFTFPLSSVPAKIRLLQDSSRTAPSISPLPESTSAPALGRENPRHYTFSLPRGVRLARHLPWEYRCASNRKLPLPFCS